MEICRFAPSTTGPAHPGTLLAALLCWLDARSRGARLLLRLEDLDPERCRPEWAVQMERDLAWLGLDFDARETQQQAKARHDAALDRLEAAGVLYPCRCTRSQIEATALPAPDGGFRYAGTCRGRALPAGGWRAAVEPLRVLLPPGQVEPYDESGLDLSQDPGEVMGDPIVRRRDGAVAYQLAAVVDDAASGVTRVVRGRDIAPSTATQVALQRLLGLPELVYRHHLLLLEERGGKLAKFHGSVSTDELRGHYGPRELCGWLAHAAGLLAAPEPRAPHELLPSFDWSWVRDADQTVRWDGVELVLLY
ncbi:MAG TPA: glutamate--tRNA ligase family protein [Myxococcota bacterium]|nr:glutamate--tRNA ligase family protein [Myxococcota bacterium]